jgi:hypothetical protein
MTATNKVGASMSVSSFGQQRLVIVGASGMVGGYAVRYALDFPAVNTVTSIGRKKLGILHPKLKEVLHQDFADCSALTHALSGQDPAVYCPGKHTGLDRREMVLHLTSLDSVVENAIIDLKPESTGREIEWRVSSLAPVDCDRGLLLQAFANLLSKVAALLLVGNPQTRKCRITENRTSLHFGSRRSKGSFQRMGVHGSP